MRIPERILLLMSRPEGSLDYGDGSSFGRTVDDTGSDDALALLKAVFPRFEKMVVGRRVVDFGCGEGRQSLALARLGASEVVGVDTNPGALQKARQLAEGMKDCCNVSFVQYVSASDAGSYDLVISQNAMEHYPEPDKVLKDMVGLTRPDGRLLITFGPPWFAPRGSHMHFFTKVPWVNILFSERTVLTVRARFRSDGAMRYEEVESGLNKMSVAKFEDLVRRAGLRVVLWRSDCIKQLDFLSRVPLIRELAINRISVVLERADIPRTLE